MAKQETGLNFEEQKAENITGREDTTMRPKFESMLVTQSSRMSQ